MLRKSYIAVFAACMAVPGYAQVFGCLSNFDVVNDTGSDAHGFEIDIEDPSFDPAEITSLFGSASRWPGMERLRRPGCDKSAWRRRKGDLSSYVRQRRMVRRYPFRHTAG